MKKNLLTVLLFSWFLIVANAQSWSPVGTGISAGYDGAVSSFAIYNDELYVGGYFNIAGGIAVDNVAKWNGTSWSAVDGIYGAVHAMCVYNGKLYAGGNFYYAGNIAVNNIARWNGTNWEDVGYPDCYSIKSLVVYNGDLYAAGYFYFPNLPDGTAIAKWNGNNWTAVGPGTDLHYIVIECMEVFNGELYAAGAYYQIGGGGLPDSYRISKWNGFTWSDVLTIPASYTLDGALGDILSMVAYNNELYIAGTFGLMIDSVSATQIAKWNGTNWRPVGTGINAEAYPLGGDSDGATYSAVKSLAVYNGILYAGGRFDSCGTIATRNIAQWDGTNWSALAQGVNSYVNSMIAFDSSLYVGGRFNYVNGNVPANNIAKWGTACYLNQPGLIYGANSVCENSLQTYSIDTVPGATTYTWNLPAGWTGSSSSNSISVIAGTAGGTISVLANNPCSVSLPQIFTVGVKKSPQQPLVINGSTEPCSGSTVTYSISPVTGATGYTWNLPPGWSASSTNASISAVAGINSGTISVSAYNNCGNSLPQILPVTVNTIPATPEINGEDSICEGSGQIYFVNTVQNATGYEWIIPNDWSGESTTDTISITAYGSGGSISVTATNDCGMSSPQILPITLSSLPHVAGINSGTISVSAYNNCGNSLPQILPVTVNTIPATPEINGEDSICEGSGQIYFVNTVQNATGYEWIIPNDWSGESTTDTISITAYGSGGSISVTATNDCGMSSPQILPITLSSLPHTPNDIEGNTRACKGTPQLYSITPAHAAADYTWILPVGWTGYSNTDSITVIAGDINGIISVKANNNCGSSLEQILGVSVDSIPKKPGNISGHIYTYSNYRTQYSIDKITGATDYYWSTTQGFLHPGATANSISASWDRPGTYELSVKAANDCGMSEERKLIVNVSQFNEDDPFDIRLFPNPSSGAFSIRAKQIQDKKISVEVFTMSGQLVYGRGSRIGANDYTELIDLKKLSQGIYVVRITIDDKSYTRRIVLQE